LLISVSHPTPNWREWVKTLGELPFEYTIETTKDGCIAKMPASADKTPYAKLLKQVMLKAAYCVGCRVCEANCRNGCISFKNGLPKILFLQAFFIIKKAHVCAIFASFAFWFFLKNYGVKV